MGGDDRKRFHTLCEAYRHAGDQAAVALAYRDLCQFVDRHAARIKVAEDGSCFSIEVQVNAQEYLNRFGLQALTMGPAQRKWIAGKLKQEFNKRVDEAFGPRREEDDGQGPNQAG